MKSTKQSTKRDRVLGSITVLLMGAFLSSCAIPRPAPISGIDDDIPKARMTKRSDWVGQTAPPAAAQPQIWQPEEQVRQAYVYPYGVAVTNKPGFVYSPHASKHSQMIKVTGRPVGSRVKCPYTGLYFLVPPASYKHPVDILAENRERKEREAERLRKVAQARHKLRAKEEAMGNLPFGKAVPGISAAVYSPYATTKMVDVSGIRAGAQVECPHTGRMFRVPESHATKEYVDNSGRIRSGVDQSVTSEEAAMLEAENTVTATRVPGNPNLVYSPFIPDKKRLVDVSGIAPGSKVKCPYSGLHFVVPD